MTAAIEFLANRVARTSSILEIGTGNGLFIELSADAGFEDVSAHEIQGSDLSRIELIANAIYWDYDYSSIPHESFDVVTLLDVMEHVIEPRYVIRACFRVLKPGASVYFHAPVVTRTDRLIHLLLRFPFLGKICRIWQRGRTSVFHLETTPPHPCGFYWNPSGSVPLTTG